MSATLECDRPTAPARPASKAKPLPRKAKARERTINVRVRDSQLAAIDQAAETLGQNRSAFILERSVQAAEAVLLDKRLFLVDDATYQAFQQALEAPVAPNPQLAALMRRKAPWER